nr:MAG TPA: hypothetical protein [Crassvirales sp.]
METTQLAVLDVATDKKFFSISEICAYIYYIYYIHFLISQAGTL